jgi:hypothetical protein
VIRFLAVIFAPILVAGCVGAGPVTTGVWTHTEVCLSKEKRELTTCKLGEIAPTPAQFRDVLGEPKSQGMKDGLNYLTYNTDIAWRGLVVFAVIPIPLLIPVGHNEATLFFDHDKLVRTTQEHGEGSFAICGHHSDNEGPGCLIWH